jgi:hypothetical protein
METLNPRHPYLEEDTAMNDQARERLCELLRKYGSSICGTPRSCEMFIRQFCGEQPDEAQLFIKALNSKVVPDLLALKQVPDWEAVAAPLAEHLSASAGVGLEEARWAVDSWGMALRRHPETARAVPPPQPQQPSPPLEGEGRPSADLGQKLLMTAAICGGIGGGVGGALLGILIEMFGRLQAEVGEEGPALVFTILALLPVGVGAVAGAAGAAVGWLGIGGSNVKDMPAEGMLPRWVWTGFAGSFGGALTGAAVGGYVCFGIIGVGIFGFLGGLTGAFTGVLK